MAKRTKCCMTKNVILRKIDFKVEGNYDKLYSLY